jgi:PAS domain S-box-containing protein
MLNTLGAQTREKGPLDLSCSIRLAQLETLYAHAPIGLCFIDRENRIVNANHLFCEMMSVTLESIGGMPLADCFPAEAINFAEEVTALLQGTRIEPMLILLPDGLRTANAFPMPVFDEVGDVLGFLVVLIDMRKYDGITPIKQGVLPGARQLLTVQ